MNTGGPAFPYAVQRLQSSYHSEVKGMTLLDWMAGQEEIGDEDMGWSIREHYAGPRPTGDWKTNPVEWHEWQARWRAGIKYTRATATLAEKARREADHSGGANKMVEDHFRDAAKMTELERQNTQLLSLLRQAELAIAFANREPNVIRMLGDDYTEVLQLVRAALKEEKP